MTSVVNDLVDGAGMTFFRPGYRRRPRACSAWSWCANFVWPEIFGSRVLIDEIDSFDNVIDTVVVRESRPRGG